MFRNAYPRWALAAPESSAGGDPVASILEFVAKFVSLSESEHQLIRDLTRVERYAKGTVLLAEGDVARESWLVIQGCVRVFRDIGGEARTLALHTELHLVIPPTYGTSDASPVTIECLEDVVVSASTPEEEARAFADHPAFESVCRVMGEALRAHLQQAHIDAVTLTPEQRYLELVARRPELLQRVPQYHVASLLGVQPAGDPAHGARRREISHRRQHGLLGQDAERTGAPGRRRLPYRRWTPSTHLRESAARHDGARLLRAECGE